MSGTDRPGEAGSITLWMLGLCVVVLFLGGLALDLWRGFAERRDLAGAVDGAAVAAASAIDEQAFRTDGVVRLDVPAAEAVACAYLREHADVGCGGVHASFDAIAVEATREVPLTLLRVLGEQPALTVRVAARVEPRRVE